jgi:hypothetical protein
LNKSVKNAKSSYKDLARHITATKSNIDNDIKKYGINESYGKLFSILGKNDHRESLIEALKLVKEELNKINV